jgi:2-haloalkanoic acid dehalogenase type II
VDEPSALRHRSTRKFDATLAAQGLPGRVVELPDSTRTAAEAARAVGCELRQIVKSLVFRGAVSGAPVVVLASGANRVDEGWMARYVGEALSRADPEFVRVATGYAIGGVPPSGFASPIPTYIDYDLLELSEVWAAAGHPHAVCRLSSRELLGLAHGRPVPVAPVARTGGDAARWVTFDCYGTLVDWRAGILGQLERLSAPGARVDPERLFRTYVREEVRIEGGPYRPYREVMAKALVEVARSEGFELSVSEAAEAPESIPDWPVFTDVPETLSDLRHRGFRIAVLSNIETDLLDRTLSNIGVRADCVVTAQEVGAYKPAPPHWIRFLKRTGAPPNEVWHVSASFEHDIEPARALGFRTVYVERYGRPAPEIDVGLSVPRLSGLVERVGPNRLGLP